MFVFRDIYSKTTWIFHIKWKLNLCTRFKNLQPSHRSTSIAQWSTWCCTITSQQCTVNASTMKVFVEQLTRLNCARCGFGSKCEKEPWNSCKPLNEGIILLANELVLSSRLNAWIMYCTQVTISVYVSVWDAFYSVIRLSFWPIRWFDHQLALWVCTFSLCINSCWKFKFKKARNL